MQITLDVTLTQPDAIRLAKNLRQIAYQQRYATDEQDLATCAKLMDTIAVLLEPKPEFCPLCGKPSPKGHPHQKCIDKEAIANLQEDD